MKNILLKSMTLLFVLSLSYACGGGGGGGTSGGGGGSDWMTVNVVSQSTATTTDTYHGNFTSTPQLFGMVTIDQTVVQFNIPTLQINLCTGGTGTGSYPVSVCNGGGSTVAYILISGSTNTIYSGTTGTVTLTAVGAKNYPVTGSFDAIVSHLTDTKRVWGSFSVTRI